MEKWKSRVLSWRARHESNIHFALEKMFESSSTANKYAFLFPLSRQAPSWSTFSRNVLNLSHPTSFKSCSNIFLFNVEEFLKNNSLESKMIQRVVLLAVKPHGTQEFRSRIIYVEESVFLQSWKLLRAVRVEPFWTLQIFVKNNIFFQEQIIFFLCLPKHTGCENISNAEARSEHFPSAAHNIRLLLI